jgi:hypothetical protein
MNLRVRLQLAEAFGPINRWFCSEFYGRNIDNPDLLLIYYIRSGGAEDFERRFDEAMGKTNRWYCSEYYRRDVCDAEVLWDYYMKHAPIRWVGNNSRGAAPRLSAELSIAC